jgi:hypothetical protein
LNGLSRASEARIRGHDTFGRTPCCRFVLTIVPRAAASS